MSDLISREAAEALFRNARKALMEQNRKGHIKDFNTRDLMLLNAEQLIHLLPSACHEKRTEERTETHACDCISRQAVIDTIETDCSWDMFNEWGSRTPVGESIIEAIKRVPSIEQEKCSDCISRAAAIVALANNRCGNDEWDLAVTHDVETIKRVPSVEPDRKKGKWIKHEWAEELNGCLIPNYECNQCHAWKREDSDYCPNCGAKMEVDNDQADESI